MKILNSRILSACMAAALLMSATAAHAQDTGFNMRFKQRNAGDNSDLDRFIAPPAPGTNCLFSFSGTTVLPSCTNIGTGLLLVDGTLTAVTGSQVNSDWNATTGVARILNKPVFNTVAYSGQAGDLTGLAAVATTGSYADLLNKPAIPAAYVFNFGAPAARTLALSTAYQAADATRAAVTTISPSCANATTLVAASACTLQVRQSSAAGLTCANGTVSMTWTSTVQLGLVFNQTSGSPLSVNLPTGGYFILCPTAGTFTIAAVEQTAG